jgi:anaerobic magnesium-protoporphyrin IX monomethyl ester cyclase
MILLIYPPFAMPDKPYIGLPTLAGYLKKKGVPVTLWDANLSLFKQLMAPGMLALRYDKYLDQLETFNENETVDASWAKNYFTIALTLGLSVSEGNEGFLDVFNEPSLSNSDRLALFRRYLLLHAAVNNGESMYTAENTGYVHYDASFSFFSSSELIEQARKEKAITRRLLSSELPKRLLVSENGEKPALIGISVSFPEQIAAALTLAAMIRELFPDIPLVLGGAFVSIHLCNYDGDELFSLVDYIALGDGEILLENLYGSLQDRSKSHLALERIPGLIFRHNGRVIKTGQPEPVPLARQVRPDYTLLPLSEYLFPQQSNSTLFQLSRGCYWARCAFCNCRSALIRGFVKADGNRVYGRLKKTLADTGGHILHFTDDAADHETLSFVAQELIREKRAVNWTVNVRADTHLTFERLLLYRQAGCFSLFLGIEAFNDRILRLMNKGTTCKTISRCLSNISWSGISANIYMIVGFPTETEKEARDSFEKVLSWVKEGTVRQVIYNIFTISPHSPIMGDPLAYSISAIPSQQDHDLAPPVSRFECLSGMDRQTVKEVYKEFNQRLQKALSGRGEKGSSTSALPWAKCAKFEVNAIREELNNAAGNR